jgi:UDP-GlcNAc:undecaprenyl-phosphate GlcNAc-1-phosphate transferase
MGALVAFAVALVMTPLARRAAFAFGVLDRPGPLKVQREPVPYLGGVAVFVAVVVVVAPSHLSWLVPLGMAAALGISDDVRSLSPMFRLGAQASIGIVAGIVAPAPGPLGVLVTAALVVVIANAVNLIDGMDALASGVVAISAIGFVMIGGDARVLALAVCGALAGFLVFNRPPARIYLGDGGAYLLGTALGMLAARSLDSHPGAWIALPFLVGLPLADAAIAILRRLRAHQPLMAGDRSHVYDQLADRGWPVMRVVAVCGGVQLVATGAGLLSWHLGAGSAAAVATATVALALIVVWRTGLVRTQVIA